jgi:hypothetical protein
MDVYKADYITAEWETVTRCQRSASLGSRTAEPNSGHAALHPGSKCAAFAYVETSQIARPTGSAYNPARR